jgi:hypothetical protein
VWSLVSGTAIDRRALVRRHNVVLTRPDVESPCQIGNGGLLYAAALMAAGWRGGTAADAPGFPNDGRWRVRCEDLERSL